MNEKKSPQVAGTTGEDERIECIRCGCLILKSDNYCSYCRKPNNVKTKIKETDFKVSLIALTISVMVLIFILSS